jgi:hypothetical protein
LLQNKPCIVTVIIIVVVPLLSGNVLFDVQGVQAEHAAGVSTVFQTHSVNPQATTTGVHMPYNWSPATATTIGVHLPTGYGTTNQPNTANTNNKGLSSTHNTASVFGAFFQTSGKTTSTTKTNNADVAKRTVTTSTQDAEPASITTSTIADRVNPGAQKVVTGGTGGSLALAIPTDLGAQAATIRATTGVETSAAELHAAGTRVTISEILLVLGVDAVTICQSIQFYGGAPPGPICAKIFSHLP